MDTQAEKISPSEAILSAALETLADQKISGARLRQIARRAGMSQGNLHYYYPTKDALYHAILDHLLNVFVSERVDILHNRSINPQEKLRYFFRQQAELIRRQKEVTLFFDFWVQGTRDDNIRAKIRGLYSRWREDIGSVIEEGVQAGVFSPERASVVPALLASILDGASLQLLMDPDAFDPDDYFDVAFEMVSALLAP